MDKNLSTRVQQALDEARTLMLTTQVLLGFEMKAVFERGFDALDRAQQYLIVGALAALVLSVALLLATSAWHQICRNGGDSHDILRVTTGLVAMALLPMAFALGVNMYISAVRVAGGQGIPIAFGLGGFLLALFFWYGWELVACGRPRNPRNGGILLGQSRESGDKKLAQKIDHLLTECRMVLPGAQALLGFQFITVLQESFEKMAPVEKNAHLVSLALVAIATVLLMMPSAYHRIVERGEETQHFLDLARWPLMIAMGFLAAGISSELFVVVIRVTASAGVAVTFACVAFLSMVALWFVWPVVARARRSRHPGQLMHEAH